MADETAGTRVRISWGVGRSQPADATFALDFGGQRLLLAEGTHLIGRSDECDILLDSELVSRRHAVLTVTATSVLIQDLGSVNGVLVDGERVEGRVPVQPGARLRLADAEVLLVQRASRGAAATTRIPRPEHERSDSAVERIATAPEAVRRDRAFELLASVVDRALRNGQGAEAERLLSGLLRDVLREAELRQALPPGTAETAALQALRLAEATGVSEWVNYPLRLFLAIERMLPLALIVRLLARAHARADFDPVLVRFYADTLEEKGLTPADRLGLQRLRTLERLLAEQR